MKRRLAILGLIGLSSGLWVSCASTPRAKRVEVVKNLQEEVDKLKKDRADLNVKIDDMKTEVEILSGKIEENQHFLRRTTDNLSRNNRRLDQIIAEYDKKLISMEDAIDVQQKKNKQTQAKISSFQSEVNQSLQGLRKKVTAAESAREKAAKAKTKTDVRYDYVNGFKRYKAKEYSSAVTLFSRYVKNFPAGRSVHNARYYLAESFFRMQDYQNAILKYEEYKEKYLKGKRVAEAIFKQALSFKGLGKIGDAKLFLEDLMANYPDSKFSKKAKIELGKLK